MKKAIALVITMSFVCLLCTSCGILDKFSEEYAQKKKNKVTAVNEEIDGILYTTKLIYNDLEYVYDDKELFFVTTPNLSSVPDENDIAIGWNGFRFGHSTVYYAETDEEPIFIYTPVHFHDLYLRSDYDYMTDTFIVEGTDFSMSLKSIIRFDNKVDSFPVSHESTVKVRLISQINSRIKCDLEIFECDGVWYSVAGQFYVTELSNDMVQELKTNNVIS